MLVGEWLEKKPVGVPFFIERRFEIKDNKSISDIEIEMNVMARLIISFCQRECKRFKIEPIDDIFSIGLYRFELDGYPFAALCDTKFTFISVGASVIPEELNQ